MNHGYVSVISSSEENKEQYLLTFNFCPLHGKVGKDYLLLLDFCLKIK